MKTKVYAILLLMLVSTAVLHAASAQIYLSTPQGIKTGPSITYCSATAPSTYTFRFSYTYCTSNCPYPIVKVRGILKKNGGTLLTTGWIDCDAQGNLGGSTEIGQIPISSGSPDLNSYTVDVEAKVLTGFPIPVWVPLPNGNASSPAITSITTNVGTVAVSNFYIETNWEFKGQAAQYPLNTTIPDICLAHIDNTIVRAAGCTGTISNYFFEVSEVDQYGNYQNGAYSGNWYSPSNFTADWWGITNHTSVNFQSNKYYKIKLAVQGPCNNWDEKSIIVHLIPDLSGRFTLYNPTNSFNAVPYGSSFTGWKGFFCSGGSTVIKFHNTTTPASAVTGYRVRIFELDPNTMQLIGTPGATAILPATYFDGPDRTLQSILNLMPFTLQSVHYYMLQLETGGTCAYDFGGVLWFVSLGTCKTDGTDMEEDVTTEGTGNTDIEKVGELGDISLFPNPANSNLNIVTTIAGDVNFTIYDLNGRLMLNGSFNTTSVLNVSSFAAGVYQVKLTTKDGNQVYKKFIKQ